MVPPHLTKFVSFLNLFWSRQMTQTSTTQLEGNTKPEGFELFVLRLNKKIRSVDPYLTVAGIGLWLFAYWVLCEGLEIWRFNKLPGPVAISKDWFSTTPFQGYFNFYPRVLRPYCSELPADFVCVWLSHRARRAFRSLYGVV